MNNRISLVIAMLGVLTIGSVAMAHPPLGKGGDTPSPDLPPIIPEGYLSPADVHARYSGPALEVIMAMPQHLPFAGQTTFGPDGERHHFDSQLHAQVSVNGGPFQPITMTGPVDTVAYGKLPGMTTGTFVTEMLAMDLTGGPIRIRESPSRPSLGVTRIRDIGAPGPGPPASDGYHIDSFFDVFTELSVDGGMTWIPKSGLRGSPMYLGGIPEPTSFVLMALGLLGMTGLARRR
jgi:hypothetical protein